MASLKKIAIFSLCFLFTTGCANDTSTHNPQTYLDVIQLDQLTNQEGKAVELDDLLGSVVLINFIFTQCSTVCPVQVAQMSQVQKNLQAQNVENLHFLSISVDPLNDTPSTLKKYAEKFDVNFKQWTFATASIEHIDQLSKTLGLFDQNKENILVSDHLTTVYLLGKDGMVKQRYAGQSLDVDRLTNEINYLSTASLQG